MKEAETALNEVKAEVAKLEDEENQLQKDVVDVKHELEKYENIMKTNQQKIKHWKKEVCFRIWCGLFHFFIRLM